MDAPANPITPARRTSPSFWLSLSIGILCFGTVLAAFHYADGDLWGKLAIGAHVWKYGTVPQHDQFAFTPVLPRYIEHEWGSGTIFFAILKWFGPAGLMWLKFLLALGAILSALATARRLGTGLNTLLLLAIPATACLLPGYVPVVRSHAFTYCFFGVTLLALESLRLGNKWPAFVLPPLFLFWSNIHGGFVAGLGTIGIYAAFTIIQRKPFKLLLLAGILSAAATLINIYGLAFWHYLIPALLHPRPFISEWRPLPLFGHDVFLGFRILFLIVVVLLLTTWRRSEKKSCPGLVMLAVTAALTWQSRRHAGFFAVTALAFAGPFLETALHRLAHAQPESSNAKFKPDFAVLIVYGLLAIYCFTQFLPRASFDVLAPIGDVPVREADILSLSHAEGNLAIPFDTGCYCSWRLYPRIKVSMDGRYETTYPEATFQMNRDFYAKSGTNWDRLVRDYPVDYVILDLARWPLRPEDLTNWGYVLIWQNPGQSALLTLEKHVEPLRQTATNLPTTTINPLDASIPDQWWSK